MMKKIFFILCICFTINFAFARVYDFTQTDWGFSAAEMAEKQAQANQVNQILNNKTLSIDEQLKQLNNLGFPVPLKKASDGRLVGYFGTRFMGMTYQEALNLDRERTKYWNDKNNDNKPMPVDPDANNNTNGSNSGNGTGGTGGNGNNNGNGSNNGGNGGNGNGNTGTNATGCGIGAKAGIISARNGGFGSLDIGVKEGRNTLDTYAGFNCPEDLSVNTDNVAISSINFVTGVYTCDYGTKAEKSREEKLAEGNVFAINEKTAERYTRVNGSCQADVDAEFKYKVSFPSSNGKELKTTMYGRIAALTYKPNGNTSGGDTISNFLGTMDLASLVKTDQALNTNIDMRNLFELIAETNSLFSKNKAVFDTSTIKPNTNANGKLALTDYITGTLVLDSSVFSDVNTVNATTGAINYKFDSIATNANTNIDLNSDKFTAFNPITTILDTKLWGFYVYFVENIRIAERYVILTLFLAGFGGLVGQKLLQAGYAYWGGNDSRVNVEWKKTAIAPMMSLIFFVAPIVPTGLKVPSHLVLQKDIGSAGITFNNGNNNANNNLGNTDNLDYTTIVQTGIQYFVRWGNTAANTFADYALYPYLKYLQTQAGLSVGQGATDYVPQLEAIQKNFVHLAQAVNFYDQTCRPIYTKVLSEKGFNVNRPSRSMFVSPSLSSYPNKQELTDLAMAKYEKNSFFKNNEFGTAKIITAEACAQIEQDIHRHTLNSAGQYFATARDDIQGMRDFYAQKPDATTANGLSIKSTKKILESMADFQTTTGWIYSALVPASYILLEMREKQKEVKNRAEKQSKVYSSMQGARMNQNGIEEISQNAKQEETSEYEKSSGSKSISDKWYTIFFTYSSYFMLPGFQGIYTILESAIQTGFSAVSTVISLFASPLAIFRTSVIGSITLSALGFFTALVGKVLALIVALNFYDIAVIYVSMGIIILMAVFRIAFYFIEVLMFFVASPAVVIWAAISNKPEVIWKYIGKAAVLAITPILIVLSCYIFIFIQELLDSILIHLVSMIDITFSIKDGDFLTYNLGLTALYSMLLTFERLFIVFAGYVVIMKFNGWFLKKIGAEEGMFDQMSTDITRRAEVVLTPMK